MSMLNDDIEIWIRNQWVSMPFGALRKGQRFRHVTSELVSKEVVLVCESDAIPDRDSAWGYRITCRKELG